MNRSDVLIIGAGPTGLVLALWLSKFGVQVRIIDKTAAPGTTSPGAGGAGANTGAVSATGPGRDHRAQRSSGGGGKLLGQWQTGRTVAAKPYRRRPDALLFRRNIPAGPT